MRSIEEMQASIKDIQSELQQLREDLDDLRSEKNGGALNFDIDEVAVKAKHDPVSPHPLSAKDEYTRRRYLILLLSVAQFEQDKLRDSLLLAHRIAYGCGYLTDGNLLDEYTSSHSLTFAQLDELVALFANDDLRLMLIEEMLIMAGQFDKGLKPAVDYISQVCQLLNITSEEITFLSQMAAVILTGDLSLYTCGRNKYNLFDCYLPEINDIHVICAKIPKKPPEDETRRRVGIVIAATMLKDYNNFSQCESVSLNKNVLTYKIKYGSAAELEITQNVAKNFVLLAKAEEIKPDYPVGVVADPIVPIQTLENAFRNEADKNKSLISWAELY